MPINIYSVQEHLEMEGWGLISDEYINLKTPLSIICPNGHEQEQSYNDWRRYKTCEICLAGQKGKIKQDSVPPKPIDSYRILALDAATNISGYSVYDNDKLVAYGTYKTDARKSATERINEFKQWLINGVKEWQPDFVGIENIQLQNNTGIFQVLANLQGVILDTLLELNVPSELTYSSEWRKTCGINGTLREAKKKIAQDKVFQWYGVKCTQDEADAICIGKHFTKINKNDMQEGFFG